MVKEGTVLYRGISLSDKQDIENGLGLWRTPFETDPKSEIPFVEQLDDHIKHHVANGSHDRTSLISFTEDINPARWYAINSIRSDNEDNASEPSGVIIKLTVPAANDDCVFVYTSDTYKEIVCCTAKPLTDIQVLDQSSWDIPVVNELQETISDNSLSLSVKKVTHNVNLQRLSDHATRKKFDEVSLLPDLIRYVTLYIQKNGKVPSFTDGITLETIIQKVSSLFLNPLFFFFFFRYRFICNGSTFTFSYR